VVNIKQTGELTMAKLAKTLFIKYEQPERGPGYFIASRKVWALVEMGEKIKVGRYELKETFNAEGVAKTTEKK
jgi:hypothetical protein